MQDLSVDVESLIGTTFKFHVPLTSNARDKLMKQKQNTEWRRSGEGGRGGGKTSVKKTSGSISKRSSHTSNGCSLDNFLNIKKTRPVDTDGVVREPGTYLHQTGGFFNVNTDGSISPIDEHQFFHPILQRLVFYKDFAFYENTAGGADAKMIPFHTNHLACNGARLLQAPLSYLTTFTSSPPADM